MLDALWTFADQGSFTLIIKSFRPHPFGIYKGSIKLNYDYLMIPTFAFGGTLVLSNLLNPISVERKGSSLFRVLRASFFCLTLLAYLVLTNWLFFLREWIRICFCSLVLFTYSSTNYISSKFSIFLSTTSVRRPNQISLLTLR